MKMRLEHTGERSGIPDSSSESIVVDQLLEDFRVSMRLATEVKQHYHNLVELTAPTGPTADPIGSEYDSVLLLSLRFYLKLLDRKFRARRSTLWFKDTEALEAEWLFLQKISGQIRNGDMMIATEMCNLVDRLFMSLTSYFQTNMRPSSKCATEQDMIKWFTRLLENVRIRSRKILQLAKALSGRFEYTTDFVLRAAGISGVDALQRLVDLMSENGFVSLNLPSQDPSMVCLLAYHSIRSWYWPAGICPRTIVW